MKKRTRIFLSALFASVMLLNIVPAFAAATEATTTEATTTEATTTDAAADVATTDATTTDAATEEAAVTYSGEYNAFMGIQTNTTLWIFRNAYDDPTYGFGTEEFKGLSSVAAGATTAYEGTFTDAVIDGDGTYTVTLENPDFQDEERLSLLYISTDIPLSDSIKVTDVKVKFDGSTKFTFDEAILDKESKQYVKILCQNDWNPDVKDLFFYPWPTKKIELTFTISGLGYESQKQAEPTAAPVVEEPAATDTTDNTTTTPATDNASKDAEAAEGLSTGAIVGIVAAAVVVIGGIAFLVTRKKK